MGWPPLYEAGRMFHPNYRVLSVSKLVYAEYLVAILRHEELSFKFRGVPSNSPETLQNLKTLRKCRVDVDYSPDPGTMQPAILNPILEFIRGFKTVEEIRIDWQYCHFVDHVGFHQVFAENLFLTFISMKRWKRFQLTIHFPFESVTVSSG